MSTVRIPPVLRSQAGGNKTVQLPGTTVGEVLAALVAVHPGLRDQILTGEGSLNRFVNVYVDGQDVRFTGELTTPVRERDEVVILPAMAGGASAAGRPAASVATARARGMNVLRAGAATAGTEAPLEPATRVDAATAAVERSPGDVRSRVDDDFPGHVHGAPDDCDDHPHFHDHADLPRHGGRYASILDAVGHTPLVEIPRMSPKPAVRLFAKLEMYNPTGSVKDRAAKYLVEDLERRGLLGPDSVILEPTSGNTGIALAMIGRRKGYRVALVMPANVTQERRQVAALFGAEIIDSPAELGSNGAIALAKHLAAKDARFVMPYQYGNPANPRAHEETTGPEILADCPEIDVFVAGLGTGGTLTGVARYLRAHKPGVRVFAAEPLPGENVQGLRSLEEGFVPEVFDPSLLDGKFLVSNRDAIAALRELVFREGIFAGPSCGAVLVAAARVAATMDSGTIVAVLPDGGWKYLSAGTFSRDLDAMEDDLEGGVSWW